MDTDAADRALRLHVYRYFIRYSRAPLVREIATALSVPIRHARAGLGRMLLFRSELHIDRWCAQWKVPRGGTLTLSQGWRLAREWYADRLHPDWRPKSLPEARSAFAEIGLTGEFWKLA